MIGIQQEQRAWVFAWPYIPTFRCCSFVVYPFSRFDIFCTHLVNLCACLLFARAACTWGNRELDLEYSFPLKNFSWEIDEKPFFFFFKEGIYFEATKMQKKNSFPRYGLMRKLCEVCKKYGTQRILTPLSRRIFYCKLVEFLFHSSYFLSFIFAYFTNNILQRRGDYKIFLPGKISCNFSGIKFYEMFEKTKRMKRYSTSFYQKNLINYDEIFFSVRRAVYSPDLRSKIKKLNPRINFQIIWFKKKKHLSWTKFCELSDFLNK